MEKMNKLSMPATILLASLIIGGFYYASQLSKQGSIERQQQIELQTKKDAEMSEKIARMTCSSDAKDSATAQYKETCTYECKDGYYYTANYENYFKSCLQSKGIEP